MSWYFRQFFRKIINPHCSSGIRKGSFDNSAAKHAAGVLQFFAQTPKQCRLHLFLKMCSPKKILCISRMNSSFSRYKMLLSERKNFAQCPKQRKIRTFPSQHFSSKLIPKKVRMHVFITTTNVLSKIPKKKLKKHKFLESVSPSEKLLLKKMQFSLQHRKFFSTTPEQFCSMSENIHKTIFFTV